ncbi:MAG TPA: BadF/BadG/BcrA/BcrD ATPase family protein [Gammaproteobacteria bacterium]|nr:BadF/BadG/BcrA/BcrD ATPase family protein [Gammaproteobacteria bacterium]
MNNLLIGVDGGASKCIVRVENESGELLGREASGPANIRISVEKTWESIQSALIKILQPLSISLKNDQYRFYAGMGLAGCEVSSAYQAFINRPHCFHTLHVTSDAYTACLGAHGGNDGAVIIAGTGTVGLQIQNNTTTKVGGWGFPQDDEGSGAWLGLQAVKMTLAWLDGRLSVSGLVEAVYARFGNNQNEFIQWMSDANSTTYAELAPLVMQYAQTGEIRAIKLLQQAAHAIDTIGKVLLAKQSPQNPLLSVALVGSIAQYLEPYLSPTLRKHLTPCQATPDSGAIILIRRNQYT